MMFVPDKITDILAKKKFSVSVEVFPPRNGRSPDIIFRKLDALKLMKPDFISITKGAMGSMRGGTVPIGYMIGDRYGMNALVHFRCRDLDKRDVENLLIDNMYFGIRNILAVLGDPVRGEPDRPLDPKTHNIYASQLVGQISAMNRGEYLPLYGESVPRKGMKTDVCIGVACYPEASDPDLELRIMGEKVAAGADFAISQMCFDADVFGAYVDRLRDAGINIPIIPGVRPVLTDKHVKAAEEIFSATVPDTLKNQLAGCAGDEAGEICTGFTVDLCRALKADGAPGVHLFTLNDVDTALAITGLI